MGKKNIQLVLRPSMGGRSRKGQPHPRGPQREFLSSGAGHGVGYYKSHRPRKEKQQQQLCLRVFSEAAVVTTRKDRNAFQKKKKPNELFWMQTWIKEYKKNIGSASTTGANVNITDGDDQVSVKEIFEVAIVQKIDNRIVDTMTIDLEPCVQQHALEKNVDISVSTVHEHVAVVLRSATTLVAPIPVVDRFEAMVQNAVSNKDNAEKIWTKFGFKATGERFLFRCRGSCFRHLLKKKTKNRNTNKKTQGPLIQKMPAAAGRGSKNLGNINNTSNSRNAPSLFFFHTRKMKEQSSASKVKVQNLR